MHPPTPDAQQLFSNLLRDRDLAVSVRFEAVSFPGGGIPIANHCHENVDRYVASANCRAVRGWLLQEHANFGMWLVIAHSVVEGPNGELFDITPFDDERERRSLTFLRHPENEENFSAVRKNNPRVWLRT
jgi:hypothetical protein